MYKDLLKQHEVYDQEYNFDDHPPKWCHLKHYHKLPPRKTKKRVEMSKRNKEDLKTKEWSVPTLPKFSKNSDQGPLDFIKKMYKSERR